MEMEIRISSSTEQEQENEISIEANKVIESAKKCVTTGEGMLRHKTHYFSNHSRKCQCEGVDLDRYSKMMR